jgi:mannan endo-1,4-beta-mannosidase
MAQYVAWASQTSIPYAGEMTNWDGYFQYTQQFYLLDDAMAASYTVAEAVVRRHNSLSGVAYADDPTIMAWELAQMPRAMRVQHEYRNWVRRFSRRIKNWDANHLITLGSEGNTPFPEYVGNSFTADHSPDEIDYTTVHIWPQDWRWYDPDGASTSSVLRAVTKAKAYLLDHVDAAEKMRKPLVLEEFGLARDESALHPGTPTDRRDEWFMAVCNEVLALMSEGRGVAGVNLWSWGGEGRPLDHRWWVEGDPLTGDPPHEVQGKYAIFDADASTLKKIQALAASFSSAATGTAPTNPTK